MIDLVVGTAGLYLAYGLFFSGVERIWPIRRGQARLRAGFWVDVAWVLTFALLGGAFDWVDSELLDLLLAHGDRVLDPVRATVGTIPASAQVIAAVVIADFSGYWKHRLHHTRWLWPVHAIHLSAGSPATLWDPTRPSPRCCCPRGSSAPLPPSRRWSRR